MKNSPNLKDVLRSQQAQQLLEHKQELESLTRSEEARRLIQMLDRQAEGGLKNAAEQAMNGNSARLQALLEGLLRDPQGAQLLEQLNQKAGS